MSGWQKEYDWVAVGDVLVTDDCKEVIEIVSFHQHTVNEFTEKKTPVAVCRVWKIEDDSAVRDVIKHPELGEQMNILANSLFKDSFQKHSSSPKVKTLEDLVFKPAFVGKSTLQQIRGYVRDTSRDIDDVMISGDAHLAEIDLERIKSQLELLNFWVNQYEKHLQKRVQDLNKLYEAPKITGFDKN